MLNNKGFLNFVGTKRVLHTKFSKYIITLLITFVLNIQVNGFYIFYDKILIKIFVVPSAYNDIAINFTDIFLSIFYNTLVCSGATNIKN